MVTAERVNHKITRNSSFFKLVPLVVSPQAPVSEGGRKDYITRPVTPSNSHLITTHPPTSSDTESPSTVTDQEALNPPGLSDGPLSDTSYSQPNSDKPPVTEAPCRPSRTRTKPAWMKDYVTT